MGHIGSGVEKGLILIQKGIPKITDPPLSAGRASAVVIADVGSAQIRANP